MLVVHLQLISQDIFNFIQPIIISILAINLFHIFSKKISLKRQRIKRILRTLVFSIVFGVLFFALGEPIPELFSMNFGVILLFTFFVSFGEEILFRGIIYSFAVRSFSKKTALHLQALVFSIIHFTGLMYLFNHFSSNGSMVLVGIINMILYFLALYWFSIVAAKLTTFDKKRINLTRPILLHWLVNCLSLVLYLSL